MSSTDATPSTASVPCRNSAGPSTAMASAKTSSCVPASRTVAARAASRPPTATTIWMPRRAARGANASTRTPTRAAAKTTSSGAIGAYASSGAVMSEGMSSQSSVSAASPCVGAGSVWPMSCIVASTAGLITSVSGLG